jgi:glycosyltransferase involved in cell wall biosynthesis
MKVTIVVCGRFHSFDLAQELSKKNFLHALITSYPKFKLKNYIITSNKIHSIYFKEIVERVMLKLNLIKIFKNSYYYINSFFDFFASKKVEYKKSDIIVGWAGASKITFLKSKKFGRSIKILERGSSHIQFQNDILLEEYNLLGLKTYGISNKLIQRELEEYSLADYISVPSKFAKNSFIKLGIDKKKLIQIPYGVNLDEFKPGKKNDNVFRIISVGSVSVRKGNIYLLKAFSDLNLKNSELIFVGPIDYEMNKIIRPYLNNLKIKFLGRKPQQSLRKFYINSSIFVINSIEEGLAMVQAQAMACGLPIISTTNSGGEDIIDNNKNGFICNIRDVEQLKEKILFFYQNKKQHLQFSKFAQTKSKNFLSWENYGRKIIKKYKLIREMHR